MVIKEMPLTTMLMTAKYLLTQLKLLVDETDDGLPIALPTFSSKMIMVRTKVLYF